jgi:hypothetical protein
VPSSNMNSIIRRIQRLEAIVSPASETKFLQQPRAKGWRKSRAPKFPPIKVRLGNLRRLPEDHKGERHTKAMR